MRQQVPTHIKEEVIRKWLSGEQRDKIASDISMGAGTVTNIISDWKRRSWHSYCRYSQRPSNGIKKIEY